MKQKPVAYRVLLLAVLAAAVLSAAPPASAFPFSGVQTAPAVAAFSKNSPQGQAISFTAGDFQVEGQEALESLVIESLPDPASGVLTLGGSPLAVGDVVAMSAVDGLRFTPLAAAPVSSTSFAFTPVFQSGAAPRVEVGLHLLTAKNTAPVAEDLEFTTYRNVAITERFAATDPEGDLLTFQLVDKPARGSVTMPEEGSDTFVYTPYENKSGKDSFTYVAIDAVGNTSEPATVKIKIAKAATKVAYADMDGNPAHKAAIRLAEEEIFVGASMGGQYFFQPDAPVTRSQFVSMVMDAAGLEALEGVTRTGFADDDAIATWAKPYVSSALKAGLIQGSAAPDGQVVFSPDSAVTRAEAAVLLDRAFEMTDVASPTLYAVEEAAPVWAVQAAANLSAGGVLEAGAPLSEPLTRAGAAELLCGALELLDSREELKLFNW